MTTGLIIIAAGLVALWIVAFLLSSRISREEERRSDMRASQPWRR